MTTTASDAAGSAASASQRRDHRLRRMTGRDPDESHRTATPLELLFDLTFVVAFSQAANEAAHLLELGHFAAGTLAFCVAAFAISWAWINYSWLASAYDTDDVLFRIVTMVQMIGVLILALGMPALFTSIDEGGRLAFGLVVAGYIVMRVAAVTVWLRAAAQDPDHRATALMYAGLTAIVQVGWVLLLVVNPPLAVAVVVFVVLVVFELAIPVIAGRKGGSTPWHPHHIAERYGLLVIITLGEVVLGTITAISAVVQVQAWDVETGLVAFGGVLLAFGLWWVYFTVPSGEVLAMHRNRAFGWGYLHLLIFGSLAATGAGLHVAAYVIEGVAKISDEQALLTVVIPVAVFSVSLFALYTTVFRVVDPLHLLLFGGALVPLVIAVLALAAGASMGTGIVLVALSPVVVIVGFETVGHRHQAAGLRAMAAERDAAA